MSTIMPYERQVGKRYLDCGVTILRGAWLLMWFCAVLCITVNAEATTYYVSLSGSDSNPGTIQEPFRSVNHAVGVLRAGDTLYIRGGTYIDRFVDTDFTAGGTASAHIVVSGYPGETVVIRNNGSDAITGFMIANREYIDIQDMKLDGSNVNIGDAVVLFNNNITFRRVEIFGAWKNGILGGGSGHQFIDLKVHGNGRQPNTEYPPGHNGLYLATDNSVIRGGEFYDNQCYGLRMVDSATNHRSSNNLIAGVRIYNNGSGKGLGGTSRCGSGGGGAVIGDTNNVLQNSLIYNNTLGVDITGLSGKMVQGAKVYNNTIYGNTGYGIGHGLFAGAADTQIINNILHLNGSTIISYSVSGTVQSSNLMSDPGFTDPGRGDFRLRTGSAAIDAGTALAAVRDDFAGAARPAGPRYDLGAYETNATVASTPTPTSPASTPPTPPKNVKIKG
jgi:hypothetical protein